MSYNKIKVEMSVIEYGSEEYKASLNLRNDVLRVPLGMNLFDEDLSRDANEVHIGAYVDQKLVGILILVHGEEQLIQMRQVAVDKAMQGRGVGKQMVEFAEYYCANNGYRAIVLHARKTATLFYKRMQYVAEGDCFLEIGIPHYIMKKSLT